MILLGILFFCLFPILFIRVAKSYLKWDNISHRHSVLESLGIPDRSTRMIGFYHPYCNAGGGGERVLWAAIALLQRTEPSVVSVVYSGDVEASKDEILTKAKSRFDIELDFSTIHFVFLKSRTLVEESTWPQFTLLGQSFGSIYMACEAMLQLIPDLYIDTMGYAFTLPVVSIFGDIPVGSYTHYPTISTDMLSRVKQRRNTHTNSNAISNSFVLSHIKLLYYRIFMYYYALSLRCGSFTLVNSTWTQQHINSIIVNHQDILLESINWLFPPLLVLRGLFLLSACDGPVKSAQIVFPPCPTRDMSSLPLNGRDRIILSIAQFRPEKEHKTQLLAMSELLKAHSQYRGEDGVKLVLIGGSRNEGDASRVEELKKLAKDLKIEEQTFFVVNAPYPDMFKWLAQASIGLNTMVDEHFGISVVEYMAAGLIPIVHASAGPLIDIVVPFDNGPTGYHATDPISFAEEMHKALSLSPTEDLAMRQRARSCAIQKFSEEEFDEAWETALGPKSWRTWLH